MTADYRWLDDLAGNNYLSATYRQGLDLFGASHFGDDLVSRDGASPDCFRLFWVCSLVLRKLSTRPQAHSHAVEGFGTGDAWRNADKHRCRPV
jgi:hypothetical protein